MSDEYRKALEGTIETLSHTILRLDEQAERLKQEARGLQDYQQWLIRQLDTLPIFGRLRPERTK